jgi:hypothetical protein
MMNRRNFLSNVPALTALAVAAPVTIIVSKPERALSQVQPMCPKCGMFVMFMRRENVFGELVPVECGCGWKGVSQMRHEV